MIILTFDTETTGFPTESYKPELVQIGAILQDTDSDRVFAEISLILSIQGLMPPQATAVHGIDDDIIAEYGINSSLAELLFVDLARRAEEVVAHNISFDLEIIKLNWGHAYKALEGKKYFDTMHELTPIMKLPKDGKNHYHDDKYPDYKAPRLQEAYEYFYGKSFANAHDALSDTKACRDIYMAMKLSPEKRARLRKLAQ